LLPLYRRQLGEAWDGLPAAIRAMHDGSGIRTAEGLAVVERGHGVLARLIAFVNRFPKAGRDIPVCVRFEARGEREVWTRTFAGTTFSSTQYQGSGLAAGLICERFGPLVFAFALVAEPDRLRLAMRRWSAFGIPLPMALGPRGETWESAEDGVFHFHVDIAFPWCGPVVAYRGWLRRSACRQPIRS
jgi:hypothetical protein